MSSLSSELRKAPHFSQVLSAQTEVIFRETNDKHAYSEEIVSFWIHSIQKSNDSYEDLKGSKMK